MPFDTPEDKNKKVTTVTTVVIWTYMYIYIIGTYFYNFYFIPRQSLF
jgi:hypothetical protein